MDVQMKLSIFEPWAPIFILSFFQNFITVRDSNGIYEGTEMYLFPHFMKRPAKAALSHGMRATEDHTNHKEGTSKTYRQDANYLLETCTTDDFITEADVDIMNNKQPNNMSEARYWETFWGKALR